MAALVPQRAVQQQKACNGHSKNIGAATCTGTTMTTAVIVPQGLSMKTNMTSELVTVNSSVKIVQTLLLGCVSTVANFREFFRPDCYELKFSRLTDQCQDEPGHVPPLMQMTSLVKGPCNRVDTLLNLLEQGVNDAIQRNYIKSLQLAIHPSADDASRLLELWTFTFCSFVDEATGARHITSIELSEKNSGHHITVPQARDSLSAMVRKVASISHDLPQLPPEKFMTLEIGYSDLRPPDYFAPGFDQPVTELTRFASTAEWSKTKTPINRMDTGYHGISLTVSHLQRDGEAGDDVVPGDVVYTLDVHKADEVEHNLALRLRPAVSVAKSTPKELAIATKSQGVKSSDNSPLSAAAEPATENSSSSKRSLRSRTFLVRPSSIDTRTKRQLNAMLQPQDDNTQLEATQPLEVDVGRNPQAVEPALTFKQSRLEELTKEHWYRQPLTKAVVVKASETLNQDLKVRCQCNFNDAEGTMLLCGFCNHFQHAHCYGYLDPNDEHLPVQHICYKCLFETEDEAFIKVECHVLRRRALYQLQNATFDTQHLQQVLKCSQNTLSQMLKEFRAAKIMSPQKRSGKTQLSLIHAKDAKEHIKNLYFTPSYGIEQYLDLATSQDYPQVSVPPTTVKKHHQKRSADEMGAAATSVPKRRIDKSASISLDLGNYNSPRPCKN